MASLPLPELQRRLVRAMTTPAVFFDPDHPDLQALAEEIGPEMRRVSLYARLSHEKRWRKIDSVFSRTLHFLDEEIDMVSRAFLERHPPYSARIYENARQFFDFLVSRWRETGETRTGLRDLARFEMAVSEARVTAPRDDTPVSHPGFAPAFRLRPGTVLIRCRHDIRSLLEDESYSEPQPRNLFLLIATGEDSAPMVMEIGDDLARLLAPATGWSPVDTAPDISDILAGLARRGFLDIV